MDTHTQRLDPALAPPSPCSQPFGCPQIASSIRPLLNNYTKPVPAVLEIPSKDVPYDPSQDSVLSRVKFMFGES